MSVPVGVDKESELTNSVPASSPCSTNALLTLLAVKLAKMVDPPIRSAVCTANSTVELAACRRLLVIAVMVTLSTDEEQAFAMAVRNFDFLVSSKLEGGTGMVTAPLTEIENVEIGEGVGVAEAEIVIVT